MATLASTSIVQTLLVILCTGVVLYAAWRRYQERGDDLARLPRVVSWRVIVFLA